MLFPRFNPPRRERPGREKTRQTRNERIQASSVKSGQLMPGSAFVCFGDRPWELGKKRNCYDARPVVITKECGVF